MAAWLSVLHMPHPKSKNIKKVHRLVVLPDFQGLGIGSYFTNYIANHYLSQNFRFTITTTNPSLIHSFKKNEKWKCTNFGRYSKHEGSLKRKVENIGGQNVSRLKVSFEYKK